MLKVLVPTIMLIPTIWFSPKKWLWCVALAHSLIIALLTFPWFYTNTTLGWAHLGPMVGLDALSSPLLILSCWLLPLMVLASQYHMRTESIPRQRTFLALLTSLQALLLVAFSSTDLSLFYVSFEATLLPTLFIITRWGNNPERLEAGNYFMFYTLAASLPLLVALLLLLHWNSTLSLLVLHYPGSPLLASASGKFWWTACLLAFLVKTPLYGVHLWLPKAHVEAPVAGSMVLAAVLLKLGGYGLIRLMQLLEPYNYTWAPPFILLSLWGIIMAGLNCTRQTDVKVLVAYASVSHMGLITAAVMTQTLWGVAGAVILMIAHGLTSSLLFCLANMTYERIRTRALIVIRGTQVAAPLMSLWWFTASVANMATPPLPNLMGEVVILTTMLTWSPWTILFTGAGIITSAAYSLYLFTSTQHGSPPPFTPSPNPPHTREHLLALLHIIPLIVLIVKPEMAFAWAS